MSQLRIPAVHVRGGTSKFKAGNPNDLQSEVTR